MKVVISKSKNTTIYYLAKSIKKNGKTTSTIIGKIGSYDEIKEKCGDMQPLDWAKEYAKKRTLEEKEENKELVIKYSQTRLIKKDEDITCNVGYFFLKKLYYKYGLDSICKKISDKYKFKYDINEILSMLVYSRILFPNSKRSSLETSKIFLEKPSCDLHQIYRALEYLSEESDFIQSELYKNSKKIMNRNTDVIYYDCTNYYFEIEDDDDFRKYGKSKEHRPNPIVQMGMFIDSDGIPMSFSMFPGNQNEQQSLAPLERKIINDFKENNFVVCTDAGLSSTANRKFNNIGNRRFITVQSTKKLKGFLKEFVLSEDGWKLPGSKKTYNISNLDITDDYDKVFYKERWINENGLEQRLIVTFSLKYMIYNEKIRERQIIRADKIINTPSNNSYKNPNDPRRFIESIYYSEDGKVAKEVTKNLNLNRITTEMKYDGLYAVCTNLEDDIEKIIQINKRRWKIEECFRIMKTEFKARPVYLTDENRIKAHFLTCFLALFIYRVLEQELNNKYTCNTIINELRSMNMVFRCGIGYVPAYKRTDFTDDLHDIFGFRTDYEIVSQNNMRKILSKLKKR